MNNPYLELTEELNRGRLRALLSSGQAVVVHRLAIMSKDGDWVLREDGEAVDHALQVLARHGAHYRFGAPLDVRWLAGGWSAHLEFRRGPLRPLLKAVAEGQDALDEALDRERRALMRANEERLTRYQSAAAAWADLWPEVQRRIEDLPLADAHRIVTSHAEGVLPYDPLAGGES